MDKPEIEYLDGYPFPKLSPKRTHALVQGNMLHIMRSCGAMRLGELGPEWRFRIGAADDSNTEFLPDVAFVSEGRLQALSPADLEEPPFAPDIAVEVRSPGDDQRYLERKISRYLGAGSVLVLDVDPQIRRIAAHTVSGAQTFGEAEIFEHPLAPWLRFPVASAFPKPRRR